MDTLNIIKNNYFFPWKEGLALFCFVDLPIESLIVLPVTIFAFKKLKNCSKKLYKKCYAKYLFKYFQVQSNNQNLSNIKHYLIYKQLNKIKLNDLPHIVEVGFVGSNFSHYPNCILTLSCELSEIEFFIKECYTEYSKKIWLQKNLSTNLNKIRSETIDAIVITHYLCCKEKTLEKVVDEFYRILKPVIVNLFSIYKLNF
jgi:hypothetical protein